MITLYQIHPFTPNGAVYLAPRSIESAHAITIFKHTLSGYGVYNICMAAVVNLPKLDCLILHRSSL